MKIFFNASLTGKNIFSKEYQSIFEVVSSVENAKVLYCPVIAGSLKKLAEETLSEAVAYFKKLEGWIKSADITVFEASYPSMGIGHEVAMALQYGKPVIVLYVAGKKPEMLSGVPNDKLQLVEYSLTTLPSVLKEALMYASEQQDTRFNFFISPKIGLYLDWISRKKKLPRAVFLRKLIEEDMKKNKEYDE